MGSTLYEEDINSVLKALRGQSIVLPDLTAILDGWPRETHAKLGQLRQDVDQWLDSNLSHSSKLKNFKAADFALFGATWWPRASYQRLKIVTFLAAWLFIWDDEIDMNNGSLWDNFELSDSYRNETRNYVQYCLGLTHEPYMTSIKPSNTTIQAFEEIGSNLRKAYNYEQRKTFVDHFEDFLNMSRKEQMLRLKGTLPSVEDFWAYRLGSSAVHVVLAVNEFAWDNRALPNFIMQDVDMKLLWNYTNMIISAANDIMSLKKEVACGSIGSIIPLLYAHSRNLQAAVDQTAHSLIANVKEFERTVQRLLEKAKQEGIQETDAIKNFINGCQYYCTGNNAWGLTSQRYGVCEQDLAKGVRMTL